MFSSSDRYQRQTTFAPLGEAGQARLHRSRVLIVGCGALGGTVADLLVRAGIAVGSGKNVGVLTLIDPDVVSLGNLHRQTLFCEQDALEARHKVKAARSALEAADSRVRLETIIGRFGEPEMSMVEQFDLLIDATDNFETRFLMNRAAVRFSKPFITAGVLETSGQMMTILPGETACLECFLDANSTVSLPDSYGILAPLPQVFANLEVMEAIKVLSGNFAAVNRKLLSIDLWSNEFRQMEIIRDENCPVCS